MHQDRVVSLGLSDEGEKRGRRETIENGGARTRLSLAPYLEVEGRREGK